MYFGYRSTYKITIYQPKISLNYYFYTIDYNFGKYNDNKLYSLPCMSKISFAMVNRDKIIQSNTRQLKYNKNKILWILIFYA